MKGGKIIKTILERYNELVKKYKNTPKESLLELAFIRAKRQQYKYMSRIYKHVEKILNNENAYFVTLTYSEKYINQGCQENAKKWAKKYMSHYIGNDDYGSQGGRYHHHIFGNLLDNKMDLVKSWKYGSINVRKRYDYNNKAIGKYIQRLKNHAVKDSAVKVFRSREKRS
ncbi:MAG: hypothetical protein QXW48_04495 [Thermoplasmata archaeon]